MRLPTRGILIRPGKHSEELGTLSHAANSAHLHLRTPSRTHLVVVWVDKFIFNAPPRRVEEFAPPFCQSEYDGNIVRPRSCSRLIDHRDQRTASPSTTPTFSHELYARSVSFLLVIAGMWVGSDVGCDRSCEELHTRKCTNQHSHGRGQSYVYDVAFCSSGSNAPHHRSHSTVSATAVFHRLANARPHLATASGSACKRWPYGPKAGISGQMPHCNTRASKHS